MRTTPLHLSLALILAAAPAVAGPHHHPVRHGARNAQQHAQTPVTPVTPQAPQNTPPPPRPLPPPAGQPTADQVAQQVQGFYDRTTDFQADFTQVSRNRLYGREERRTGHVLFKKPGRMRWNYNQPSGDTVVTDGTTLWAYTAEEHQMIQQTLAQSQLPSALTFLAGTGRLTDAFTFRLLDAGSFHFPNGYVLELRPIQPSPTYDRIVFYVDRATFQIARTVLIDAQGNQNRFDFSNPQVNMNVPESTFHWTPPPGTTVIRP